MNVRKLTITALLTAAAIIIPYVVVLKWLFPLQRYPWFPCTHVFVHVTGAPGGSYNRAGFCPRLFLTLGPLIGARAFMHVFVALPVLP